MYFLKQFLNRLMLNTFWSRSVATFHSYYAFFPRRLYFEKQNNACPYGVSCFCVIHI